MPAGTATVPPTRFLELLADPQRWRLVQELAASDRKVTELTRLLGKPQNLVSYHLANLRDGGIVSSRRSAADGRDTYYSVDMRRCSEMLGAVGEALQPGLRLRRLATRSEMPAGRKPRVLFLCTGNTSRSQMAEALAEQMSGGAIEARSAGSHPKALHPNTLRVMAERGIDMSGQRTKHLDTFLRGRFDRVITLCDKVREICPEFPGAAGVAHWSMADPAAEGATDDESYAAFVRTADELESRIGFLIDGLSADAEGRRAR